MKTDEEEHLNQLLREWHEEVPIAPTFRADVWQRIAVKESSRGQGWATLWRLFSSAGPAWLFAIVVSALIVGSSFGWRTAQEYQEAQWSQLGERYAHSINPISLAAETSQPLTSGVNR